ncbi:hypothetical protein [Streptomyces sp. NPDC002537]
MHLGIAGLATKSGGHEIIQDQSFQFELPGVFDLQHIHRARNDLRVLHDIFARYPGAMADLHNATVRGDRNAAVRIARNVGLTEEEFQASEGGFWWYIAGAAVVIAAVVIAGSCQSDSGPYGPGPEEAPDAGADAGADAHPE